MKTILITGGTGFLGSHLVKSLLADNYTVVLLKRKPSSLERIASLIPRLHIFDVEDGLEKPFEKLDRVDVVIHTATCYGKHGETVSSIFDSNVVFPLRLLETAILFNTDTFFNTDTYFNTESPLTNYLSSYALSKRQFMEQGKLIAGSGKIRFLNLRLEHLYGPEDDNRKFVPHIIRNCLQNVPELQLTLGEQKRDFVYIDDVAEAYITLLDKLEEIPFGFIQFGIGTGQTVSIRDFVSTVHRVTGSKTKLVFGGVPYRENEIMNSSADVTGIEALGWRCQHDIESGIRKTLEDVMRKELS